MGEQGRQGPIDALTGQRVGGVEELAGGGSFLESGGGRNIPIFGVYITDVKEYTPAILVGISQLYHPS